jgi:hypothetical protein
VENPALPPATGDGSVVDFSSNGYPGFSDVMDLRARGSLSDDIVFRVRAPFASLWRAEAFDTYDGSTWTRSVSPLTPLDSNDAGGYDVEGTLGPSEVGRTLVQTFFIEQQQPNVLFAAAAPRTVLPGWWRSDRDGRSVADLLDGWSTGRIDVLTVTPEWLALLGPRHRPLFRNAVLPATLPQRVKTRGLITAGCAERVRRRHGGAIWRGPTRTTRACRAP